MFFLPIIQENYKKKYQITIFFLKFATQLIELNHFYTYTTDMNSLINPGIDVESLRVMVVDDVPLNVLLIKKMLSQYTFKLITANSGQSALDQIEKQIPDLLLLDLMMPGIDGFEVIRRLRSDEKTKELPIIILSALNSEADIVKGFQLGANDFINKPIIMEKLLNSVTTQINLKFSQS